MFPRPATLALSLLATLVASSLAPPPVSAQSPCGQCPHCVMLVGMKGAVADPVGNFCVVATDPAACLPMGGALITVDFSGCPGVSLCSTQPDPTMIVNCAASTVAKVADATGTACFDIVGGSQFLPAAPCPPPGCVRISANGVLLCTPSVVTPDLDNVNGVSSNDLSIWLSMYFAGPYCSLGDYDCDGTLSGSDLSQWLNIFFAGGSVQGCSSPKCP